LLSKKDPCAASNNTKYRGLIFGQWMQMQVQNSSQVHLKFIGHAHTVTHKLQTVVHITNIYILCCIDINKGSFNVMGVAIWLGWLLLV